jgi:hypothetical protein
MRRWRIALLDHSVTLSASKTCRGEAIKVISLLASSLLDLAMASCGFSQQLSCVASVARSRYSEL